METSTLTTVIAEQAAEKRKEVKIAVIDDDAVYRKTLEVHLKYKGAYGVQTFRTGEEFLLQIDRQKPDIVILDYFLNDDIPDAMTGLQMLKEIVKRYPHLPVVMLSGQENINVATNCIRFGAFDYIVKNESAFIRLRFLIDKMLHNRNLQEKGRKQEKYSRIIALTSILAILTPVLLTRHLPEVTPALTILLLLATALYFSFIHKT